MTAKCIVCGKTVAHTDQQEHLATNHLGPHYFWHDARKYKTMKPSMMVGDLKHLVHASAFYQMYEDRAGELIGLSDSVCVDLTRGPHFCSIPPATY